MKGIEKFGVNFQIVAKFPIIFEGLFKFEINFRRVRQSFMSCTVGISGGLK